MSSYKKQAIKVQGLQIMDALLVWCGFALAYVVRDPVMLGVNTVLNLFGYPLMLDAVGTMGDISSLLVVIVPFTPLVLELTGFYHNPFGGAHFDGCRADGLRGGVVVLVFQDPCFQSFRVDHRGWHHRLVAAWPLCFDA